MMRGKRENFFSREKKPNVGFVILFPLSRHSLGDGGSIPFKKSGETFLFAFTCPCREQSLVEKSIVMDIIDCHIHAEVSANYMQGISRLIARMQNHGISKAVISDLGNWQEFPDEETLVSANERVRRAAMASDGRLEYLVYINPQLEDWRKIFDRFIEDSCGVKLWISLRSKEHGLERSKEVLRLAAERDKAVLIHTFDRTQPILPGEIGIAEIIELAEAAPDCRIVAAHAGGNWRKTMTMAKEIPQNVVFDISGGYPERTFVKRFIETFGSSRVLYGSDAFFRSFGSQLSKLDNCGLSESDKERILCANAMRIFKIPQAKAVDAAKLPVWSIPSNNVDNFCFVGKGRYWDHHVTCDMLVEAALKNHVDVLHAASLGALCSENFIAENLRFSDECARYFQIKPLAAVDLRDLEQSLSQLEKISGFAGVLISPCLHNYRLDYQQKNSFFDACSRNNIPVWINTALGDDRFRNPELHTHNVSVEEIIEFVRSAPLCRYTFQGCPADIRLYRELPAHCSAECSRVSDFEYAPDELFSSGYAGKLCFGSEYPFREYSSVRDVLCGRV